MSHLRLAAAAIIGFLGDETVALPSLAGHADPGSPDGQWDGDRKTNPEADGGRVRRTGRRASANCVPQDPPMKCPVKVRQPRHLIGRRRTLDNAHLSRSSLRAPSDGSTAPAN